MPHLHLHREDATKTRGMRPKLLAHPSGAVFVVRLNDVDADVVPRFASSRIVADAANKLGADRFHARRVRPVLWWRRRPYVCRMEAGGAPSMIRFKNASSNATRGMQRRPEPCSIHMSGSGHPPSSMTCTS